MLRPVRVSVRLIRGSRAVGPSALRLSQTPMDQTRAREALRAYCKQHMTYSKDPAINCTINQITSGTVYRVQLDTFMESRTVKWTIDSYPGQDTRQSTPQIPVHVCRGPR